MRRRSMAGEVQCRTWYLRPFYCRMPGAREALTLHLSLTLS
jgi:hypothetical protein